MPDCDYCDAEFDDEDAYLSHLAEEHRGELKRIDQRRVENFEADDGDSVGTTTLAIAGVILVGAAVGVYLLMGGGGGGSDLKAEGIETEEIQEQGDPALLEGVQTFEHSSNRHVASGSELDFKTMPPTGGPHYSGTVRAGFYEGRQSLGALVHNLEHGHVVIYYDPAALDQNTTRSLQTFANRQYMSGSASGWARVVVVPNPQDDPESPFVLTAWNKMLRMNDYDPRVVYSFISEYVGRGPENPVR